MHIKKIFFLLLINSIGYGQTWAWTYRTHGELDWNTLTTEHFRIHYHDGIEQIAKEGATISEQVLPTLLEQMDLDEIPIIDIIFTTEDEIMNGFAGPTYQTFIWVDQNDAAIWLEDEKWLFQVVSHELQHIVFFHRVKTWLPEPWSYLISQTPGWVVEGLAEYETERWRPYRSEIRHKYHVLKNEMETMDPHHDGFSKLLYWSSRFGDSTIVNTLANRNSMGLFNFNSAFKNNVGITVDQFNEDWRRHMNTYYYGYRAQKEAIEEIGQVVTLPIKKLIGFNYSSDSTKMAIIGLDSEKQRDMSLYVFNRDSSEEKETREKRLKSKEQKNIDKKSKFLDRILRRDKERKKIQKEKPIIIWDKEEIDYGNFHPYLKWSPNNDMIAYSKYHYGAHQSLVYDIKVFDLQSKSSKWITSSKRASYPSWSPDGKKIVYVAHNNSIANLYVMNIDGTENTQITSYNYDTQIVSPNYSPDGKYIVFCMADKNANLDLYIKNMDNENIERLTFDPAADYDPVWHPDGKYISYTSHASYTPNIHTIDVDTKDDKIITDVGDAVWAAQWSPKDSSITARTLADVDTVRLVKVDPHREVSTHELSIRDHYSSWKKAGPGKKINKISLNKDIKIISDKPYKSFDIFRHQGTLVLPDSRSIFGFTQWSDKMNRHLFTGLAVYDLTNDNKHLYLIQYTNAMKGPIWGLTYNKRLDIIIKPYDNTKWGLYEENSSIDLWFEQIHNFGDNMSNNHRLLGSIKLLNRDAKLISGFDNKMESFTYDTVTTYMPNPRSGNEFKIRVFYEWLNRRPHAINAMIPKQGYGAKIGIEHANSAIYGEFDYTRISTDMFLNISPINDIPAALFTRLKTISIIGDNIPSQDLPAITNNSPIYIMGQNVLGIHEAIHLRGWNDWRIGDKLVYGTIEPRIGGNQFVLACYLDFGNAWYSDGEVSDMLYTGGYELRINLGLVVLSYGAAQDFNRWKNNNSPYNYLQMALVNPF
ncbi:MAG: DPP IV N-terminal domain-containing protein [Candidatus Neomarinimicrobiota bacterium]|nr:DPP IV N-terminal domain-containing protein [Candidatus Neomarinimicrobiota bacterium]